jgi:hypothetical protein
MRDKHGSTGKRGAARPWAAALVLAGLSLAAPLRADLGARLNVAAHALAAKTAVAGQPIAIGALQVVGGQAYAAGEQALIEALRQALIETKGLTIRPEGAKPEGADLVLDGQYRAQGQGVSLSLHLHPAAGGADAWARTVWIPDADLPAGEDAGAGSAPVTVPAPPDPQAAADDREPMAAAGAGDREPMAATAAGDGMVVPTLPSSEVPRRRVGRPHRPFHMDLSAGYEAFFPVNSTFKGVVGDHLDGVSLGLNIQDVFLADLATWHADVNGPGTLQALDYYGLDLAVVAPWHLGPVTLYAGPGGRFGSIELSDSAMPNGSVGYGNNGFLGVAGVKVKAGSVGLDLRYSYDLVSSYTGYHAVRLGAFYEFGR